MINLKDFIKLNQIVNGGKLLTKEEKDALVGTSGDPSSSNKFVTDTDTRLGVSSASSVIIDPSPTLGSSYELGIGEDSGLILLKPHRNFPFAIADAVTSPPPGFTLANSANLLNADADTTTADGLFLNGVTSGTYRWSSGVFTSPYYYKPYDGGLNIQSWICRASTDTMNENYENFALQITEDADNAAFVRLECPASGSILFVKNSVAGASAAITAPQAAAGIWMRIDRMFEDISVYYSTANQATPPTAWTFLDNVTGVLQGAPRLKVGMMMLRDSAPTGTNSCSFLYYDDRFAKSHPLETQNPYGCGGGHSTTGPVITLITSFNLGSASAVISNTHLQNTLARCENVRLQDSATWTYSAVRGSSENPAAGSYSGSGSVTISGIGKYFALHTKATSNGQQPASFDASRFRLPVTPS